MSLARRALLALSTSAWLRDHATKSRIVRRSVRRFMPGERLEDALEAARQQQTSGITAILTHLGENLTDRAQADGVARHYIEVLDRIAASGVDAHISVKLTQLGLDFDHELCFRHLRAVIDHANPREQWVWIDMESSAYVDRTLDLFHRACRLSPRVGIALQAYLHRTEHDLDQLLSIAPAIRLVKGAYLEPPSIAFPKKADVDDNYYRLGVRLLTAGATGGPLTHIATHDPQLVDRLGTFASAHGVPSSVYEYAMLYGIQRPLQERLAREQHRVRVLIAYGDSWFPWYMRRLAERPANVWFLIRNFRI